MSLLEKVNSPEDIRGFSVKQLETLCSEIRQYMIGCCATNPGHLGSSLGAVELAVALHYTYNTPTDKIVWDVGHQAYAHKIITGRREQFRTNRTYGGISGFPKMSESIFDAFGVGHSSTSVSAALGMAIAAKLSGSDDKIVAVIGDGAMTGGMAFEGLNNAGAMKTDILVILNDNHISIDHGRGGMHDYLLKISTSETYNRIKNHVWEAIGSTRLRRWVQKVMFPLRVLRIPLLRSHRRPRHRTADHHPRLPAQHQGSQAPARHHQKGQGLPSRRGGPDRMARTRHLRPRHRQAQHPR